MLNVQRLRILRELERLGTLARVAGALDYTPSAVSQQLAQLERETGVALLEHVGRGVRLTPEAVVLVRHADAILARMELAESDLAAAQPSLRGTLRVASFQTVVIAVVPTALTLLAERHPELDVEITQREMAPAYEELQAHGFDVILGEEYPGMPEPVRPGIDREDLLLDSLCLVLPLEGTLSAVPGRLSDLADAPWALDPADSATGAWARSACRRAGFEPIVRFESPDPLLHAHLVRSGHALAFIPALIAAQHLQGTRLARLPDDPHRVLYTAVRSGRSSHPAIRAFRQALTDALSPEAEPAWDVRLRG